MNRTVIHGIIIGICTAFAVALVCAFDRNPDSSGFLDGAQILSLQEFQEKSGGGRLIDFQADALTFNGVPAACDLQTKTYYLPQSLETSDFSGELVSTSKGYSIYFCEDEAFQSKAEAVKEGHSFSFILTDQKHIMQGKIVFTGMPSVSIYYSDGEIEGKEKHTGTIVMSADERKQMDGSGSSISDCIFHVRGNTSAMFEKKSYKISLYKKNGKKNHLNYLGLRNDDDWILNSIYTDVSRAREKVCYDLWKVLNERENKGASSCQMEYVEVFLNNRYAGVYGLMVPVDGKQLQMEDGDILYKVRTWMKEYTAKGELIDYNGQNEIPNANGYNYALIKYPGKMASSYNWKPLQAMQDFVYKEQNLEKLRLEGVVLNRDNVILHGLFCELTHAMDNTWKNTYVAAYQRDNGTGCDKQYELFQVIWDLNYTFGDEYTWAPESGNTIFSPDSSKSMKVKDDIPYLYDEYMKVDSLFLEDSAQKWKMWRDNGISAEYVISMFEENQQFLLDSGAGERESSRYPEMTRLEDTEEIKTWIRERFTFLDQYYGYE